ncbi:MAG: hypothetical protein PVJ24_06465, partial [Methyloceanibacter sp.]
ICGSSKVSITEFGMSVALEISALRHPFPFLDPALDRVPQAMAVPYPGFAPGRRRSSDHAL